jgi:hypothetical protein
VVFVFNCPKTSDGRDRGLRRFHGYSSLGNLFLYLRFICEIRAIRGRLLERCRAVAPGRAGQLRAAR